MSSFNILLVVMENLMTLVFVCLIIFAESHLEHHALEDCLVADLARLVPAEVEEGDGGAIRIPARQDGELPLTQLRLQRPAAVIKETETLAKSEINVIVNVEVL